MLPEMLRQGHEISWIPTRHDRESNGQSFEPNVTAIRGCREAIDIDDGLQLVRSDVVFDQDAVFPVTISSVVKFHFRFKGTATLMFEGHEDLPLHENSAGVLFQNHNIPKYEFYESGQHEQAITLLATLDYLNFLGPDLGQKVPSYSPT